jgi:hypothetical protein
MKAVMPRVFTGLLGLGAARAQRRRPRQAIPRATRRFQRRICRGPMKKNPSDKMGASRRIIKPPPGVDPEIVKPAPFPEPNSTPVIPPPGLPGGPPSPAPNSDVASVGADFARIQASSRHYHVRHEKARYRRARQNPLRCLAKAFRRAPTSRDGGYCALRPRLENQASQKYFDRNVESPTDMRGAYFLHKTS